MQSFNFQPISWLPSDFVRFREAVAWALELHEGQVRRRSGVPFAAHLLAVASVVIDYGGGPDAAIAAILHDAIEDQGGDVTAAEIERRFGGSVLRLVEQCTDARTDPKPPWRPRKEAYLLGLQSAERDALLITAADKLHNLRCLIRELKADKASCWESFRSGREGALWYFREVFQLLQSREDAQLPTALLNELEGALLEFEKEA